MEDRRHGMAVFGKGGLPSLGSNGFMGTTSEPDKEQRCRKRTKVSPRGQEGTASSGEVRQESCAALRQKHVGT